MACRRPRGADCVKLPQRLSSPDVCARAIISLGGRPFPRFSERGKRRTDPSLPMALLRCAGVEITKSPFFSVRPRAGLSSLEDEVSAAQGAPCKNRPGRIWSFVNLGALEIAGVKPAQAKAGDAAQCSWRRHLPLLRLPRHAPAIRTASADAVQAACGGHQQMTVSIDQDRNRL